MGSSFRHTVSVSRPVGDYDDNGLYVSGTPTEFTVQASVQPADGQTLESLPHGRREKGAYVLYTDTPVFTVNEDNPDVVTLFGKPYEIVRSEPWQNGMSLDHYRALAVIQSQREGQA